MGVKITVAGANKMKRKNDNGSGLGDVAGEGKSLIKTLFREIGIPATLGLVGAALASVWTKRGADGKYGPMFALTAVALAWGVPRFLLRSLNLSFLDRKTAERAGAFAVAFALGWDTVIAPLVSGNRDHIISKIVTWAQELVAKDPAAVQAALQHNQNNNYGNGGGAEHSFNYTPPASSGGTAASSGGTPASTTGGSSSTGGGGGAASQGAQYIAAGGQALGAILQGVGALAGSLRGGSTETAGGTAGMAGPARSVISRAIARG